MEILCLGLSHHTAPIEVRERFAIPDGELPAAAAELARIAGVGEALIVSTCNRVEFYVARRMRNAGSRRCMISSLRAAMRRRATPFSATPRRARCGIFFAS